MLTLDQRTHLLQLARTSIEGVFEGLRLHIDAPEPSDETLKRPAGAFVSLHTLQRELRGCIGTIEAVAPLYRAVASNAVNAAFRDPRFHPMRREELGGVHIEISVMSPIVTVQTVEEIEVGRDGLIIRRGGRAGLLLPQVASEYGWSREEFLSHTCLKAGLPPDTWRSTECLIERFSAEVFGE